MAAYASSFQSDAPPASPAQGYDLDAYVRKFEEAEESTLTARANSEKSRDYLDNKQWTAEQIAALKRKNQAPLVINRIKRKADFMKGYERKMRTDPKALPRTPKHDEDADAATDSLRFVADTNRFDMTRSAVFENLYVEGYGGCDVTVEQDARGKIKIKQNYVSWDRIFYDPHSRMPDFSDARYFGMVVWLDRDEALAMAKTPEAREAIESTLSGAGGTSTTFDDKPAYMVWTDNRRTRVRIVQMWCREPDNSWHLVKFTRGGVIEGPDKPYVDEDGLSVPSLILESAYIDRENNRYGEVWTMLSMQDELNVRRSKALHLFSTRQTRSERGAVADINETKRELAKPDGHIETNKGFVFEVLPTGDMAAGQFELLAQITNEMDQAGPNASMAGKDPRQQSGRAIIAQQTGGMVEAEPLLDNLRDWTRRVHEATWLRIRQFWKGEQWVRVTDDENNLKWVGLNQPITLADALAEMQEQDPDKFIQTLRSIQPPLMPNDRRLQEQVEIRNEVAQMDVDISIDAGPDVPTAMAEQFQQAADMATAGVPIPPELLVELSSLRGDAKKRVMEKMQEAQAAQGQAAQQEAEANLADTQAKTRKTTAEAMDKEIDVATKAAVVTGGASPQTQPEAPIGDMSAGPPMEEMAQAV